MINEPCNTSPGYPLHHLKCVSWSAILVGALVGIGLSFLLNLFSVAIGLSIVRMANNGLASLAVGGFIGLLIGSIVAMFVAGFSAGYLGQSHCVNRNYGVLYGFTTWCVALILMVMLAADVGHYVSSYAKFITHPTIAVFTDSMPLFNNPNMVRPDGMAINHTATVTTTELGYSAFLLFILFFIGALSSCFGGHYGMLCKNCHEECGPRPHL